jgi:serine/threonine protein kinase
MNTISDDALARFLIENEIVGPEKINAARVAQSRAAVQGTRLSLLEALNKLSLISTEQLKEIERQLSSPANVRIHRLGDYKLIRKIGEGGMGAVYLAEDTVNHRRVAVKVLSRARARDADFLIRFQREAKAAIKLRHENLLAAYAADQAYGRHYYVMEFCDGEPLDKILSREGFLPWERAVNVVQQIARGLDYAHTQGFIHRDVKPGNIFVTSNGVVKIIDMGLLKHVVRGKVSFTSKPGLVVGSPHYLAPEQIRAEKNVDGRADLYALGATFYHVLTGQTPFTGDTPVVVLMKHLDSPIPNPKDFRSEIPDGIIKVVRRMMAKDPSNRYGNCAAFLADLKVACDEHAAQEGKGETWRTGKMYTDWWHRIVNRKRGK